MKGALIKIKPTGVIGIVMGQAPSKNGLVRYRVLGVHSHRWYELNLKSKYIEVISESR